MLETYKSSNMLPKKTTVEDCRGSRDTDIITQQFSKARLYLVGEIDQKMAMDFVAAMSVLADEQRDVEIIINSPGGEVSAGLVIYDIIQSYQYRITMYCTGLAASMGAVILAGGQRGRRYILPHSKVMIHEPLISGGMGGSATTIEKTAQNILETKSVLNKILSRHTGKTIEKINEATLFDNYMTAEQAVEFGICDDIRSFFTR
ncbi:ATP-dependent Clp protease proteolytic subunit [Ruminococcus sp. NK3A76]|uniref:ClpP family protease n=1 Tax=Ruminococcus sp. NK3A76 TaxID=877411 RepID=UPI00048B0904|nr:ATP-dependent Clp protease proteolytic subunit [Ruminococcus sp. NK3A76]